MTQANVPMRSLDQSRYVTNRQAKEIRVFDDANLRVKSGKGVGRNFWPGMRDRSKQGGLACVRITNQPNLRDQLQFEDEVSFLPRFTRLSKPWRLACGRREITVSQATTTSLA